MRNTYRAITAMKNGSARRKGFGEGSSSGVSVSILSSPGVAAIGSIGSSMISFFISYSIFRWRLWDRKTLKRIMAQGVASNAITPMPMTADNCSMLISASCWGMGAGSM